MTPPPTAPPALARRLLAALLPFDHRGVVLAHLDAEFQSVARVKSSPAALWWYRGQVVWSIPGALRLLMRAQGFGLRQDVTFGWRILRGHPGFALAVTVTLALAVGATSAVLTLASAVLLRPLPFHDPARIVSLSEIDRSRESSSGNVSWPDFIDYGARNHSLQYIAAHNGGSRSLQIGAAPPERVSIAAITPGFFDVLGVRPFLGRSFTEDDAHEGAPPAVILTHGTWRTRFGADASVVGQHVMINGVSVAVVGVWPVTFEFPPRGLAELWLPLRPSVAQRERKYFHWMNAIARLRDDVTLEQARQDLDTIARGFATEDPRDHANAGMNVVRLRDHIVGEPRPILVVLSWAAILVLLVACANVAGLLLARGAARQAEIEVRGAMGAGRWRLARQLLMENLVLALPGGLLGLCAGQWAVALFVAGLPAAQRAALPHLTQLRIDTGTVVFGLALLVAVVLAFGLVPALRTSRGALALAGRGAVGRGRRDLRLQLVLVTSQVALALMLLSGAGLMTQSVRRLLDVSPGFSTERLLTFRISLSGDRYQTTEAVAGYFQTVTERIAGLPGVEAATAIDQLPLTGPGNSGEFTTIGDASGLQQNTLVRTVAPNYFQVLGIAVEQGRGFAPTDQPHSPRVVLVNRRLADTVFGGLAIGRQVSFPWSGPDPWEIVGITGDERFDAIDQPIRPVLYFSSDQSPSGGMSLLVRTKSEPLPLVPAVRTAVSGVEDTLPMFGFTTMDDLLLASEAVFRRRAVLLLLAGFALVGLVLASVGVYGVLAQIVADRTREIGVRIALGADRREIVISVLRRGMAAAAIGMVVGAGGSTLFGQALQRLLFATAPSDAPTLLVVIAVFLVVTILACVIPSRRVLRIDPVAALRGD